MVIEDTFWRKPCVKIIFGSQYIGEKGLTSGSETGPKICCAVFFNLADWIFLIFSRPLETNNGYIYAKTAYLKDFRFLTFLGKKSQELTFWDIYLLIYNHNRIKHRFTLSGANSRSWRPVYYGSKLFFDNGTGSGVRIFRS